MGQAVQRSTALEEARVIVDTCVRMLDGYRNKPAQAPQSWSGGASGLLALTPNLQSLRRLVKIAIQHSHSASMLLHPSLHLDDTNNQPESSHESFLRVKHCGIAACHVKLDNDPLKARVQSARWNVLCCTFSQYGPVWTLEKKPEHDAQDLHDDHSSHKQPMLLST